jgi:hypothetical protein
MFNKCLINISALWWIVDVVATSLKESLSNSLVNYDQSDVWHLLHALLTTINAILFDTNSFKSLKFCFNDSFSHGVTNTISVNEDMFWESTIVVVSISLERACKILIQGLTVYNFFALLLLRIGLSVEFTHKWII